MSKAVITILGTISGEKVKYSFEENLKQELRKNIEQNYINTLPLLIEHFKDYKILPLYTKKAKEIQEGVLRESNLKEKVIEEVFKNGTLIEDENNFIQVFQKINSIISCKDYNEIIVDITHGFRHLPLLSMISLIIQNIQNPNKIKHILFGKEIVKGKEYKIVDLIEYLDISNIAYALTSFDKNFTVASQIKVKNKNWQKVLKKLTKFSQHMLSNSLTKLFFSDNPLINDVINELEEIKKEEINKPLLDLIKNIISFLRDIKKKANNELPRYQSYYNIAEILYERGYFSNAVLILYESICFYTAELIKEINQDLKSMVEKKYNEALDSDNEYYTIYQFLKETTGPYFLKKHIRHYKGYLSEYIDINGLKYFIEKIDKNDRFFEFLQYAKKIRNEKAHVTANSIKQIKTDINNLFSKYKFIVKKISNIEL